MTEKINFAKLPPAITIHSFFDALVKAQFINNRETFTKPTRQGTGLGLSLSYDIIKAHGGEIKMESKERERTEFIIQLPV